MSETDFTEILFLWELIKWEMIWLGIDEIPKNRNFLEHLYTNSKKFLFFCIASIPSQIIYIYI